MFLRHSNAKLQEELRDTMKSYGEEKSLLRAHLGNLRFEAVELHNGNRTVTTADIEDDLASTHLSMSNVSDAEIKTLDDDPNSGRLPALKLKGTTRDRTRNKTLRFDAKKRNTKNKGKDTVESQESMPTKHKSFFNSSEDIDNKEQEKFSEMQRNREILRNIGKANLRDKRNTLIRLPTITSAKIRSSDWDSGEYVCRPKGKSTEFETHPYLETTMALNKNIFKIPKINDPQRSERQLKDARQSTEASKKKVQFTRPHLEPFVLEREKMRSPNPSVLSSMGTSYLFPGLAGTDSLNTTLADTTLDTTFGGNVTFDEEYFRNLAHAKTLEKDISASLKSSGSKPMNNLTLEMISKHNSVLKDTDGHSMTNTTNTSGITSEFPPKLMTLNLKSLETMALYQDLNPALRVSPRTGRIQKPNQLDRLSPGEKSLKSSDRSVGTRISKISKISQDTSEWKSHYQTVPDQESRNKALSDIMYAVRTRMRENEATLRFGESPRPSDHNYGDLMMAKHSPRWKTNETTRQKNTSPRKAKVSYRSGPKKHKTTTHEIQSLLNKMQRQRRAIDRVAGDQYRLSHYTGHKDLHLIAQKA